MFRIVASCVVLSLAACVVKSPLPDENWRLIGKLSLKTQKESRILGIDWIHLAGENTISLRGPLGVKVALITTAGSKVSLKTGDKFVIYDENDVLTNIGVGELKLPWQNLVKWVRFGEPDKSRLGNWQFKVMEASDERPSVMKLEHPEITMKLKVNRWEIP